MRDPNNQVIKNTVVFINNIFEGKIPKPDSIYLG